MHSSVDHAALEIIASFKNQIWALSCMCRGSFFNLLYYLNSSLCYVILCPHSLISLAYYQFVKKLIIWHYSVWILVCFRLTIASQSQKLYFFFCWSEYMYIFLYLITFFRLLLYWINYWKLNGYLTWWNDSPSPLLCFSTAQISSIPIVDNGGNFVNMYSRR